MTHSNDFACRIYVESELTPDEIVALLAASLGEASANGALARTVPTRHAEIDVRKNKEADRRRAGEFPDGFLYFRYALELYPSPTARPEEQVSLVGQLLQMLWSRGLPAIAACDNENELPRAGGYNNRSVPWPSPVDDPKKGIGCSEKQTTPAQAGNAFADRAKLLAELEGTPGGGPK